MVSINVMVLYVVLLLGIIVCDEFGLCLLMGVGIVDTIIRLLQRFTGKVQAGRFIVSLLLVIATQCIEALTILMAFAYIVECL